jgi:hypothetical protein
VNAPQRHSTTAIKPSAAIPTTTGRYRDFKTWLAALGEAQLCRLTTLIDSRLRGVWNGRIRQTCEVTTMMRAPVRSVGVLAAACLCLWSFVAAAASPPETWDGLERRKAKGVDLVYVRPGVEFKVYRSLVLDPVQVAFDKSWDPNRDVRSASRRLSASDMQEIRDGMGSEFRRIFGEELAAAGYDVVAKPLEDTLQVTAALADVYINAPDAMTAGRTTTYTMNAGRMTLVMELRDGPTGQLLARVVDRHVGNETGFATVANSVTNSAEFRRAVTAWAKRLVKGLDRLQGKTN